MVFRLSESKELLDNTEHIRGIDRPFDALSGVDALQIVHKFYPPEQLQFGDQSLEVHDLIPEFQTGAPIVFVAGYYAEGDSLRQVMYDTYLSGRRSLTFNGYHGIDCSEDFLVQNADKIQELRDLDPGVDLEPQLRKAAALIAMLDSKGLNGVDLFAHSEGAIVATIAAYLRPELFKQRAYLSPAGMIGNRSKNEIIIRKLRDDADVISKRNEQVVSSMIVPVRDAARAVLPAGILDDEKSTSPLRYRQISQRYGEDPKQDLNAKQIREVGRTSAEWRGMQADYFKKLKREYNETMDKEQLGLELSSLVKRRLDRWLAAMDTTHLTIAACERDRLYPPQEVASFAEEGGVQNFYVIDDATHNVQHFEPQKVTAFLCKVFSIHGFQRQQVAPIVQT